MDGAQTEADRDKERHIGRETQRETKREPETLGAGEGERAEPGRDTER